MESLIKRVCINHPISFFKYTILTIYKEKKDFGGIMKLIYGFLLAILTSMFSLTALADTCPGSSFYCQYDTNQNIVCTPFNSNFRVKLSDMSEPFQQGIYNFSNVVVIGSKNGGPALCSYIFGNNVGLNLEVNSVGKSYYQGGDPSLWKPIGPNFLCTQSADDCVFSTTPPSTN